MSFWGLVLTSFSHHSHHLFITTSFFLHCPTMITVSYCYYCFMSWTSYSFMCCFSLCWRFENLSFSWLLLLGMSLLGSTSSARWISCNSLRSQSAILFYCSMWKPAFSLLMHALTRVFLRKSKYWALVVFEGLSLLFIWNWCYLHACFELLSQLVWVIPQRDIPY